MQIEVSRDVAYDTDEVLVKLSPYDLSQLAQGEHRVQTFSPAAFGVPRATRFVVVYDAPKPEVDDIALD